MLFVYMKCRFSLSYRDLEEIVSIRGAQVDHATLQRWVIRFVPLIDAAVRKRKKPVGNSWRMDETDVSTLFRTDCQAHFCASSYCIGDR